MEIREKQTVGATVAEDYRSASVFQQHGIDFCCKGGQTIEEACSKKGIDRDELLAEIKKAAATGESPLSDFNFRPLDELAGYIEEKHHAYVAGQTPALLQFLNKLCNVHGEKHPELFEVRNEFTHMAQELAQHMKKEELILFPAIKNMVAAKENHRTYRHPGFGTVQNPIRMMMQEHRVEGDRMAKIESLTQGYTPPADGCTTYQVAYQMLRDFNEDLHLHIHLENNILFPKAAELENTL